MAETKLLPEIEQDLIYRRKRLGQIMQDAGVDRLLISSATNLFYIAGCVFRGYIYLESDGYALALPVKGEIACKMPCIRIRKPELIADALLQVGRELPSEIALEADTLTYNQHQRLAKCFHGAKIHDASPLLRKARTIKTEVEIEFMKSDGLHHVEVYRHIGKLYRDNMTDLEFQIEIERELRKEGALGFLRTAGSDMEINMGSVLAGDNADTPSPYDFSMGGAGVSLSLPVGANGTMLRTGMTVMVDMNGNFNGYQTDLTRVWSIGEPQELTMKAHKVSQEILEKLERIAKPGVKISDICKIAYDIVERENLSPYFMGHKSQAGFIGHGVGIELNEQPVLMMRNNNELQEGMTIAIEPKFVIPGVGAIGNENTYVVRKSGLENLTPAPNEIGVL